MASPLGCIRNYCVECSGGNTHEVKYCTVIDCPLYRFRSGRRPLTPYKKSPLKCIREKCMHDCGEDGAWQDVKNCEVKDCPLYALRFGSLKGVE